MTAIVWDERGDKFFQTGIEKGVLYLFNGFGLAWNGLTSVSENTSKSVEPVYLDGTKVNDLVKVGDFQGSLKAITYPEEFLEYEGYGNIRSGAVFGGQPVRRFGLSYVTSVGNDLEQEIGYKLHLLYNVTAVPSEVAYNTMSDSPELVEFSWDFTAVPIEIEGFAASAHVIFDSRYMVPELLGSIEDILYGSDTLTPRLPPPSELLDMMSDWYVMYITDNRDGSWTATTNPIYDPMGLITLPGDGSFTIERANAIYIDSNTYTISNTYDELPPD